MDRSDLPRFAQMTFPAIEALNEARRSLSSEVAKAVADAQEFSQEQPQRQHETTRSRCQLAMRLRDRYMVGTCHAP